MKLTTLNKKGNRIRFELKESNKAFANALRRIMMTEIPVMAIEYVDIEKNNSGLFDEIIAHRLGLIPLTFSDNFLIKNKCKCNGNGCSRCEVVFVLEKKGPCIVRAADIKSTDESVSPTDINIPIVELLENQELKFEAIAQLGIGKEHIKWQASIAGYSYMPKVKVKGECNEVVDACPVHVFEKKDGKVKVGNEMDCILCMKCVELSENVSVTSDDTVFVFDVESVSGLPVEDVLRKAVDILENKTEKFLKEFKKEV